MSNKRMFNCNSFIEFYLLEGIHYHLHNDTIKIPSDRHFLPSTKYLAKELDKYKDEFETSFALRLRDYLWFAAIGEARHSRSIIGNILEGMEDVQSTGRGYVYDNFVRKYPPNKHNVDSIIHLFHYYSWDGTYGGTKWAKIAKAVAMYDDVPAAAFIDHCADLQHNGGIAFDKSVHFWSTSGYGNLIPFLNFKFHAKSVVFDLPRHLSSPEIRSYVSSETIYLMNKLFAVSKMSPWYDTTARIRTNSWSVNLALDNQYSGHDYSFGDVIEVLSCYNCGNTVEDGYNAVYSSDGYYTYCEDCCTCCEDCGDYITPDNNSNDTPDGYVCDCCFGDNWKECDNCYNTVPIGQAYCEDCESECSVCNTGSEDIVTLYNLDELVLTQSKTTSLSSTIEDMCPACILKHLNAGYRFFKVRNKIYTTSAENWEYLMSNPWGELLTLHMEEELSYYQLIPENAEANYG